MDCGGKTGYKHGMMKYHCSDDIKVAESVQVQIHHPTSFRDGNVCL